MESPDVLLDPPPSKTSEPTRGGTPYYDSPLFVQILYLDSYILFFVLLRLLLPNLGLVAVGVVYIDAVGEYQHNNFDLISPINSSFTPNPGNLNRGRCSCYWIRRQ